MAKLKGERRIRHNSEVREMARAEGYVMCRHKGCIPFAMSEKEWAELPLARAPAQTDGEV